MSACAMNSKFQEVERVLVTVWPGLGDILYATPALRALRTIFPQACITVLSLWGDKGKSLLESNPYVDRLIFTTPRRWLAPHRLLALLTSLRNERFQLGVQLSFPTQWLFWALGIRLRTSFGDGPLCWIFPWADSEYRDRHASEQFLKAIDRIDGAKHRHRGTYDLVLTDEDRKAAREVIVCSGLVEGEGPLVVVHPGSRSNPIKRWPLERFVELLDRLYGTDRIRVILVGGKDERDTTQYLHRSIVAPSADLSGSTPLRTLAALVDLADLYIGHDTGPTHVAASTRTPVVAIYASSNPKHYGPLNRQAIVVVPDVGCAPCSHFPGYMSLWWGLSLRYRSRCWAMESITVERVMAACRSGLGKRWEVPRAVTDESVDRLLRMEV